MSKPAPTSQKLRGGYYTPEPIAKFLARWAIQSAQDRVLEPSCGDGAILEASLNVLIAQGASKREVSKLVQGIELDDVERNKALGRFAKVGIAAQKNSIHLGDFFAYCRSHLPSQGLLAGCEKVPQLFDAVVGNPPFVRYQNFAEEHREPAFDLMRQAGMSPTRLTNSWVPFIVASAFMLNEKGRLAMVVPAELLQVNYSAELRRFLSDYFNKITLITFKKLVFDGIQQEVVLLLAERNGAGRGGIRVIEFDDMDDLASYEYADFARRELKPMDHSTEKWTQYFLDKKEIELLRELRSHPELKMTGDVMEVDVGIVTGQNQFFVMNQEQLELNSLQEYTHKIVGRSAHLSGLIFSEANWLENVAHNYPAFLLNLPNADLDTFTYELREYVKSGEIAELNTGYKCRIRQRWYVVPSVWTPDAFMLRQIHTYPKIILNQAQATCTDTIHRVRFRNQADSSKVTAAFMNSLTFAFSEVVGRSYGGGVLELEPNEAEKIPLPLKYSEKLDVHHLHDLLMSKGIAAVLDLTDQVLLTDGLGLARKETKLLHQIRCKLRDRRINRKKKGKTIESPKQRIVTSRSHPHPSPIIAI